MTLQSSGAISISQINSEFGRGNDLNSYRGTTWYTDAGGSGTFSSGAISMSEFYGKRKTAPVTISLSAHQNHQYDVSGVGYAFIQSILVFYTNGTWAHLTNTGPALASGNWATPTTTGIGSNYWIRFTRTSSAGPYPGNFGTASTGWLRLDAQRLIEVNQENNAGGTAAYYNIDISSDSGGSTIVASCTGTIVSTYLDG